MISNWRNFTRYWQGYQHPLPALLLALLIVPTTVLASVDVEHYYAYLAYQKTDASEMTPAPIIAKERDGSVNIPPGNYYLQLVVVPEGSPEQLDTWKRQRDATTLWAAYTIKVIFKKDKKNSGVKLHQLMALENTDYQQSYANLFNKQTNQFTWEQLSKNRIKNWFAPLKQVSQGTFYPAMFRTLSMGVDKNDNTSAVYPGNYQGSPTYIYRLHQLNPQDKIDQKWIKRFWDPGNAMEKNTTIDAISSDVTTAIDKNRGFYRAKYFAVPNEKHRQLLKQFSTLVVAVAANSEAVVQQELANIEKEKANIEKEKANIDKEKEEAIRKEQLAKQKLEKIRKNKADALKRQAEEAYKQSVEFQKQALEYDSGEQNQAVQSKSPQSYTKRNTNPSHSTAAETTTRQVKPKSKNNHNLGFVLLFIGLIVSLALGVVYFLKPELFERNRKKGNHYKDSSASPTNAPSPKSSVKNDDRGSGMSGDIAKSSSQQTGGTNPFLKQSGSENETSEHWDGKPSKPVSSERHFGSEYEEIQRQQQREDLRTIQREKEEKRKRKIEEQERLFALDVQQKDEDRKRKQQQRQRQKQPGLTSMEVQPRQEFKHRGRVEQQPQPKVPESMHPSTESSSSQVELAQLLERLQQCSAISVKTLKEEFADVASNQRMLAKSIPDWMHVRLAPHLYEEIDSVIAGYQGGIIRLIIPREDDLINETEHEVLTEGMAAYSTGGKRVSRLIKPGAKLNADIVRRAQVNVRF